MASKIKRIYEEGVLVAKECTKCHEIKSVSEFSRYSRNKTDGLQPKCKQCDKQWCDNNKEHRKEYNKQWRENNKEHRKEYKKEWNKQWYENNKEYMKEWNKQYYENNKEHRKEYKKQYYNNKIQEAIQEMHENVTKKRYPHNGIQYGIIYGVYNTITNRWYIGQTTTSFEVRYKGNFFKNKVSEISEESSRLLVEDIETYGEGSFQIHEVIDVAFSEEELDALEVYYIDKYKAYDEGYNSNRGNINGKRSYREA